MTTSGDRLVSTFLLNDAGATEALAQTLARTAPPSAVVFLHGDLGAGKSTLARAWLRALGVQGAIRSPTYTLVERYRLPERESKDEGESLRNETKHTSHEALHLDLYRIGNYGELEFLGLDDTRAALWLVEWPERGEGGLPNPDLRIRLALPGDGVDGRICRISMETMAGQAWHARALAGC
jgi:tRNA threonylcarbamoyladenosine biosynthesis protein TsaE